MDLILAFRFDLLDLLPEIKASSQAKSTQAGSSAFQSEASLLRAPDRTAIPTMPNVAR